MIKFKIGNLFEQDVEALVNPVNCVGVMQKGVALQFKYLFPDNFDAYKIACKGGQLKPGKMFCFEVRKVCRPKYIINFPTKRHWRESSRMADIESGLVSLRLEIARLNIRSIAIPAIGCGLGGLNWNDVKQKLTILLDSLEDCLVIALEPQP